jgi:ferredoxin hydrogenase large subunit
MRLFHTASSPLPGEADAIHFVDVIADDCRSCGHCEGVCPTSAITRTDPDTPWCVHYIPNPSACIACGQCLKGCPGYAIVEKVSFLDEVKQKLNDPDVVTVAMPAPSIRYTLGEAFGDETSRYEAGKMFAALRQLGFDKVWDVEFGADVTIMEESAELLARIRGELDRPLPLLTSCCPGWVRYVETYHPSLIPNLSTASAPAQMLGALAKTRGASEIGVNANNIYTVQIMPCIAKKFEGLRIENARSGFRDIDATIDTRELIEWLKDAKVNFDSLADEQADDPFRASTGAATIFGATGGVMEAALRRVVEELDGKPLENVEFQAVRGTDGVREAEITAGGMTFKVAVVSGAVNAESICAAIEAGTSPYAAVEVMACPGGCLNGGGQPIESEENA